VFTIEAVTIATLNYTSTMPDIDVRDNLSAFIAAINYNPSAAPF